MAKVWPRISGGGEVVSQGRRAELRRGSIQSGHLLRQGEGVAKDHTEAVKWYRKAAEQNSPWLNSIWAFCYVKAKAWRRIIRRQ